MSDESINTGRLDLVLLRAATLRALLVDDREGASREQGIPLPAEFSDSLHGQFLTTHLQRAAAFPGSRGWGVRVIVRQADGRVIGHAGFHGPPDAVGRAEIGYSVFAAFRGQGYATETARALADWARAQGERTLFASVSPVNQPSLAVVHKLGFRQAGVQVDQGRGPELVFELILDADGVSRQADRTGESNHSGRADEAAHARDGVHRGRAGHEQPPT
ncbi:MAG: GNAT family N-acetyltransferase [Candidatus Dormibacteraeota bacterium]|nr:GNAT family N-acetyltransferase [Candidatus Dormibacteraeota bacterium]